MAAAGRAAGGHDAAGEVVTANIDVSVDRLDAGCVRLGKVVDDLTVGHRAARAACHVAIIDDAFSGLLGGTIFKLGAYLHIIGIPSGERSSAGAACGDQSESRHRKSRDMRKVFHFLSSYKRKGCGSSAAGKWGVLPSHSEA